MGQNDVGPIFGGVFVFPHGATVSNAEHEIGPPVGGDAKDSVGRRTLAGIEMNHRGGARGEKRFHDVTALGHPDHDGQPSSGRGGTGKRPTGANTALEALAQNVRKQMSCAGLEGRAGARQRVGEEPHPLMPPVLIMAHQVSPEHCRWRDQS